MNHELVSVSLLCFLLILLRIVYSLPQDLLFIRSRMVRQHLLLSVLRDIVKAQQLLGYMRQKRKFIHNTLA